MFERHRYPRVIILQAVYFKLRFSLSYRDVEELMEIRGVKVDHATIQRWVFKFTPMLDKEFRKRKKRVGMSWRNKTKNGEPINFDQFSALVTS